jgi:5-methylcytosine-specific restriction endonuclease McrA
MPTPFDRDVSSARMALAYQNRRGRWLSFFTLGLIRNSKRIRAASETLDLCVADIARYLDLEEREQSVDYELSHVLAPSGTRTSNHPIIDTAPSRPTGYGLDWEVTRKNILSRDHHTCTEANGRCFGPLQVHHIVPLSRRGTNHPDNLVTLCLHHHIQKHPHMRRKSSGSIRRRS